MRLLKNIKNRVLIFLFPPKDRLKMRFDSVLKNADLMDNGVGKIAVIFATGPSVKEQNLKLLVGFDCFSVSNFFLHEDINLLKPKYHFFAPYHQPLIWENYVDWLRQADQQLPAETGIFLGLQDREKILQEGLFKNRDIRFLDLVAEPYFKPNGSLPIDITGPVLSPQTVPLMVLPVLFYMGYKTIYLVGCDHNGLKNYGGKIAHFYASQQDTRVIARNYWGEGIEVELKSELNVFITYSKYAGVANSLGVRVINLSPSSWLDIFPRELLNDDNRRYLFSRELECQGERLL